MTDNALRDIALTDIALTDIALTDIALTDKALIDQALIGNAFTDNALTGKAWNDNASLSVGACPTGTQAWLKTCEPGCVIVSHVKHVMRKVTRKGGVGVGG